MSCNSCHCSEEKVVEKVALTADEDTCCRQDGDAEDACCSSKQESSDDTDVNVL